MKRLLALMLCLMLFAPAALAAEQLADYYKPPAANEGQYPIAQSDVKLTYWMPLNAGAANFIASYDDNPSYQLVQKATGVDIEFIHPAAGTEKESFNLMLASGELPDIIQLQWSHWYNGNLRAMYDDGIIIDLTPYLEQHAPQYLEVINQTEQAQKQIYSDGQVLGFYKITYAEKMPYDRFNVNKDWLDEAGMAEPKTIAQYEAFFDWILANKPGCTPCFFGNLKETGELSMNLLMGAFDVIYNWYVDAADATQVRYWAAGDNYREFLEMISAWYDKGYLGKDFMSLTITEAQAMFDAGKLGCIADSVDATYSRNKDKFTVTNLPYMRKTEDYVLGANLANTPVGDGGEWVTVVTSACKNVEAAIEYLNYGYTYEGSLPFSFGVEGEHWNWGENGLPQFTDEILNNEQGMTISNVSYALKIHFGSRYCYPDAIGHPGIASNQEALNIRSMWADDANEQNYLQIPPIVLTAEESAQRADLMVQVETYAKEMLLKFITGAEPLDNYDAYEAEINAMGLTDALAITQTALDRFLAS
jgi:putative aldouronate transport system substrate-binding protein